MTTTPSPSPVPGTAASNGVPVAREAIRGVLGGDRRARGDRRGYPGTRGPGGAPLAMAGVHDHSAFRTDPIGRLQRTTAYVTTTTFGSTREALRVSERVRAAHRHVHGTAPDGRTYRADDPHLLAWVSIALTSSFLQAHRLWVPLPLVDEDAFVAEQSRIAAMLDPRVDLRELQNDEHARAVVLQASAALTLMRGVLGTSPARRAAGQRADNG